MPISLFLQEKAKTIYNSLEDGKIDLKELKHFLRLVAAFDQIHEPTESELLYQKMYASLEKSNERSMAMRKRYAEKKQQKQ